jgi:release factor glutamine methyltransferase
MLSIYSPAEDSFLLSSAVRNGILKILLKNKDLKVLEMGCGSGFQLKALFESRIKKQNIFACDINPNAIKHCKKLGFNCVQSDLFESIQDLQLSTEAIKKSCPSEIRGRSTRKIKGFPRFDLIIFNPPYLPEDSREPKDSQVATTGGKNGGETINRFLQQAKNYLAKGGKILLLTSSLTKGIKWKGYNKKLVAKQKLFFEELYVWEMKLIS